jgi:hypothetical protein
MSASQTLKHLLGRLTGCDHAHLAFRALRSRGRRVIYVSHADIYAECVKKFPGFERFTPGFFFVDWLGSSTLPPSSALRALHYQESAGSKKSAESCLIKLALFSASSRRVRF